MDLVNYNLGWRPPGPVVNKSGIISAEAANMTHSYMEKYIGSDQSELGVPVLSMQGEGVRSQPPYLACSDHYNEFVRHGKIEVVEGRLTNVHEDKNQVSVEVNVQIGSVHSCSDIHIRLIKGPKLSILTKSLPLSVQLASTLFLQSSSFHRRYSRHYNLIPLMMASH